MEPLSDYDALLKICESRKSARSFDTRPVPAELLEKIKKIAYTSPYASGKKNWEIRVVTDPELLRSMKGAVERRTRAIQDAIRPDMQEFFADYARNFVLFASAPAVFIPLFRAAPSLSLALPGPQPEVMQWERDNYVKSISCVAMLILLAAESLGLGGCYMTGALIADQEVGNVLHLPESRSIGAIIPIGYASGGTV